MICSRDVERRDQLAVVVVEHDVLDADAAAGFLRLGAAPRRERASALGLMSRVAVGDRDEPHAMAERGVLRRRAAGALIAVVGMRAKRDDVQLAVGARRLRALGRLLGNSRDADTAALPADATQPTATITCTVAQISS